MTGAHPSWSELGRRGLAAATIIGLCAGFGAAIGPAAADKVGVAAAVNPDAFSSLAGAPQSQLNIGKSIFYNERINTTGNGLVQVLLVDGSTFTVGPGSDLVIDKFVYDPKKGTGQIAASFSKGVMRFVGGKLSKNDGGVTVDTPAGALAIRGGIAYVDFKSPKTYSILFVFGEYLKLQGNTLFQPGYGWFSNNGEVTTKPFTGDDLKGILAALKGGGSFSTAGNQDGKSGGNPGATGTGTFQSADPSQLVNSFTQSQIQNTLQKEQTQPTETEQTETVDLQVYRPGETYTYTSNGQSVTLTDPGKSGILGGDPYEDIDAFQVTGTYTPSTGRLTGNIGSADPLNSLIGVTSENCPAQGACTPIYGPIPLHQFNFPYYKSTTFGWLDIGSDQQARITSPDEVIDLTGRFYADAGFFAYQLFETPDATSNEGPLDKPVLIFGGTPYTHATDAGAVAGLDPGELHSFSLYPDPRQNSPFPFASTESSPIVDLTGGATPAQPLLVLQDANPVWLQSSFYIGGTGSQQQSFVLVALGNENAGGGLVGERGGSSHLPITVDNGDGQTNLGPQTINFDGGIATLPGPGGNYYFGADTPHLVIGHDTLNGNPGVDEPLNADLFNPSGNSNNAGATYHVGVETGSDPAPTKSGGIFNGYATGMVEHAGSAPPDAVVTTSPKDFNLNRDAATNTLTAGITVTNLGLLKSTTYKLALGGAGNSAYIDDGRFAALHDPSGTNSVSQRNGFRTTTTPVDPTSYLVSSGAIDAENALLFPVTDAQGQVASGTDEQPLMSSQALCTQCEFLKWGAWGTQVAYDNNTDAVHLGWWIAGQTATNSELENRTLSTKVEATYSGHAIGNVASRLDGQEWVTYVATGGMDMTWNFGYRKGQLDITNFDVSAAHPQGYSYSGTMLRIPGLGSSPNQFGGVLAGSNMIGAATGSFVHGVDIAVADSTFKIPQGVIGNWNVGNSTYNAVGIFGGSVSSIKP
jgi:hypothetical protein